MRKLVTKRTIDNLRPIDGADMIECAVVGGWTVVVKKGEFSVGDECVFFEIDSFLPADDERFEFLKKSGVKKDPSGRERIRLRTVKLRKQLSQGLALPIDHFPEIESVGLDEDVSEVLDVIKYERPEPTQANAAGTFPDWISKTDEERIQNLYKNWSVDKRDVLYTPTLKLDGSSITMIYVPNELKNTIYWESWEEGEQPKAFESEAGQFQICSRNMKLKYDPNNHFWKGFFNCESIGVLMRQIADEEFNNEGVIVFQGELMGPGIQNNIEKFNDYVVYLFSMYDVHNGEYYTWRDLNYFVHEYTKNWGIKLVPEIGGPQRVFRNSLEDILEFSDGPSIRAKHREGIVWKGDDGSSFKSISNKFLLKGGDE